MTRDLSIIVKELELCAAKQNALIGFQESFKPFGHVIRGNRDGFVRLAIECLLAAQKDADDESDTTSLTARQDSVEYLAAGEFDRLLRLDRDDNMVYEEASPSADDDPAKSRLGWIANAVFVGMAACCCIGLFATIKWLWNAIW